MLDYRYTCINNMLIIQSVSLFFFTECCQPATLFMLACIIPSWIQRIYLFILQANYFVYNKATMHHTITGCGYVTDRNTPSIDYNKSVGSMRLE